MPCLACFYGVSLLGSRDDQVGLNDGPVAFKFKCFLPLYAGFVNPFLRSGQFPCEVLKQKAPG